MGVTAWISVMALLLTSAASVIALLREKRDESTSEHRLRRWLKLALFVITAIGLFLGIYIARTSDKANRDEAQKHLREQEELQGKLDSSLQAQQYARAQLDSIALMVRKFTQTDKSPAAKKLATIVNQTAAKQIPETAPHLIKVKNTEPGNFHAAHQLSCVPDAAVVQMTSLGSIVLQEPKEWDDKNLYLTASDAKLTADVLVWCETKNAPSKTNNGFHERIGAYHFSLGENGLTVSVSVEDLKKGSVPFAGLPITVFVKDNDSKIHYRIQIWNGLRPLVVTDNEFVMGDPRWDRNYDETALEVVDEKQMPVLQAIWKTPSHLIINGIFKLQNGDVVIADNQGWRLMRPGDSIKPLFKYPSRGFKGQYVD